MTNRRHNANHKTESRYRRQKEFSSNLLWLRFVRHTIPIVRVNEANGVRASELQKKDVELGKFLLSSMTISELSFVLFQDNSAAI